MPTILKYGSNQAIRFAMVESLKDWYLKRKENDGSNSKSMPNQKTNISVVPPAITFAFGALSGAVSVYGNNPVDVIKTRMQGLEAAKYRGTIHCAVTILKREGVTAFYKGCIPRLGRACLDAGLTFMAYDAIMQVIGGD